MILSKVFTLENMSFDKFKNIESLEKKIFILIDIYVKYEFNLLEIEKLAILTCIR